MNDSWTFLSNHGHVLMCIAQDPDVRVRDIAERVGITERSVTGILTDLEKAGVIEKIKDGRRNSYRVIRRVKLRHPLEAHRTVGSLIDLVS
jgi:DNA-binding MarR family transcriptional regulator